jgi:pilus assembly protein FimV
VRPPQAASAKAEAPSLGDNGLDFTPAALPVAAPVAKAASAPAASDSGMMEFDLNGLSLDLPGSNAPAPAAASSGAAAAMTPKSPDLDMPPLAFELDQASTQGGDIAGDDADNPLATKLALAEEFNAIGDADGARSLAEEVLAEASGDLKSRAQRLLAEIG